MDTRLLRTFLAVARTESFTAAAGVLKLSQSTVTVQIKSLERELGTRLFDRMARGAQVTAAGRRLLAQAADVLEAESRLRAAAAGDTDPAGIVVVGAAESLCASRLPHVVGALRETHKSIDMHLFPAGTGPALEGLRAGRLDVALLLEDTVEVADMTASPVGREPLVLVSSVGHPLATSGQPVTWEDLARESFLLHEEGCSYSDRVARELLAVPGARPRLTRFGSIEAARSCVAAGLGLSVLPLANVDSVLRDGSLAVVAGPRIPDATVQLVRHRGRSTSPAVQAVIDALRCYFSSRSTAVFAPGSPGCPDPASAGRSGPPAGQPFVADRP
ncbi:LysR family transcriptional regulator [Micromonospora deserti]|uniref:LysR family transcriptional regulator n=1 Tax=Micromonospora deserti TaxID=2070366 RepID=A0A2W2CE16_9ACTN|nr:LysR family transcriptional regulator [Micromonospora deserti]PZF96020.1 LysR family transcriptional regulator [Micromonospora deserti]